MLESGDYVGVIKNYRRGPKSQRNQECLIKVLGVEPSDSSRFLGWKVEWPANGSRLTGIILKTHGRTGALRVKFKKGLPGQALGTKVKISRE
jgi:large subunit ribosomal protein L35Ae